MKAIIWTGYGSPDVLQLQEIDMPTPKDDEILVRTEATTAFAGDIELRQLKLPLLLRVPLRIFVGWRKPKRVRVLGQELAGVVEAVGKDVTKYKVGDEIFGATGLRFGAYAEYACLPESGEWARKPPELSFTDVATIPVAGMEALAYLRKGNIRTGERILINGAGGSIGTYTVQLAKHMGAEVTAVDSTEKLEMLKEIGADHVIDYREQDFAEMGETYDLVFDTVGKDSFSRCVDVLTPNGRYLLASATPTTRRHGRQVSRNSDKQVIVEDVAPNAEDMAYLADLIVKGAVQVVVDRTYPLAEMAEAHRFVETGRKKGHVVITV